MILTCLFPYPANQFEYFCVTEDFKQFWILSVISPWNIIIMWNWCRGTCLSFYLGSWGRRVACLRAAGWLSETLFQNSSVVKYFPSMHGALGSTFSATKTNPTWSSASLQIWSTFFLIFIKNTGILVRLYMLTFRKVVNLLISLCGKCIYFITVWLKKTVIKETDVFHCELSLFQIYLICIHRFTSYFASKYKYCIWYVSE